MVGGEADVRDHIRAVEEIDQHGRRAPVADALVGIAMVSSMSASM